MQTVYDDKFQTINHYPENSLLECIWKNTQEMEAEDFKNGLRKQVELVKKYNINKELFDTQNFFFPITPEIQEWTNEEIYSAKHKLGVRQFALVVPGELLAQLALEQTTEEGQGHLFNPKYFATGEEAKAWLSTLPY